ncbi:uncharacterized protein [Henckelia pumila]|uniref:uncharacterized protein n=1 Tax=Henckelia pumila TaxID=405737 RepID=UPI003C6E88B6
MKRIFLEKYFPASRAANIRKKTYGIKQYTGESLHEYWEQFKKLYAASGGVFMDKTPIQARNLIENMAVNFRNLEPTEVIMHPRKIARFVEFALQRDMQLTRVPHFKRDLLSKLMQQEDFKGHHREIMILNRIHTIQETRASIQNLNTQVGQLATAINMLEAQNSSSLPSQTMVNPKENNEDEDKSKVEENELNHEDTPRGKFPPLSEYKPVAPFPLALKESRKVEGIKGLYETFRRCEGWQKVELGEQVSAIIQRQVPTKCKDPEPLNETEIVIQMADRSTIHPRGVLEDVFVQVGNLVFSADFYVHDIKNNDLNSPILLGRSFLKTSKSIIDVNNDTLTMEFDGEIVKFHIFDTLKIPSCESVVNHTDVNDHLSQEHMKDVNEGKLKEAPQTKSKIPPDRAKGMPKEKGRSSQETGISRNQSRTSIDRK